MVRESPSPDFDKSELKTQEGLQRLYGVGYVTQELGQGPEQDKHRWPSPEGRPGESQAEDSLPWDAPVL